MALMDSSLVINCEEDDNRFGKVHALESAYQESLLKMDLIIKDENARRLRLRILLLENENNELHEQLALDDDRINDLELDQLDLQKQFEEVQAESQSREIEIRAHAREQKILKAEINSMNGLSVDSTKLLTEKLALARQVATIQPELEHLRTQAAYQQTILADKLALQRQVNTLEVELETVKISSRRAPSKTESNEKGDDHQKQLDELRKEISQEKRNSQKAQRAAEKASSEWNARKDVLESKVEALRTKLRLTKEQLKDLQTELTQSHADAAKSGTGIHKTEVSTKNPRKRTAVQMTTDAAIGTPDGVAVRGKRPVNRRGMPDQMELGEKSMFSITPYLKRTASIAPETPNLIEQALEDERADVRMDTEQQRDRQSHLKDTQQLGQSQDRLPSPSLTASSIQKKPTKKNILQDSKAGNKNVNVQNKKPHMMEKLEKVPEEEDDENEVPSAKANTETRILPLKALVPVLEGPEPKKKKRKLLGISKTLFDEEDGEAAKRPTKIMLGPSRVLGRLGKNGVPGAVGSVSSGFGAFSPLKKDKRGIQASFLAQ